MANPFDQFDAPTTNTAASPAAAPVSGSNNPFDRFDAPSAPVPVDRNAINWSRYNQPFGELKPTDYSPTETIKNTAQDVLMSAGARPQVARHLAEGAYGIANLNPITGSAMSGADLPFNLSRGNYGSAALDVVGAVPGAIAGKRLIQGMPTIPMADIPKVPVAGGPDELKAAASAAYDRVRNSAVVYHPQMLDDLVSQMRINLTRRGLNSAKAPSTFATLDAASAPRPRGAIVTPDDLDTLRQQLRGGVPGTQDGLAGGLAVEQLDRHMANPPPQHVLSGSRSELDTLGRDLATARGNYRAYKTADTVEGKIDTAAIKADVTHSGGNLDNTTRQYLASLTTTKAGQRAMAGATPEEKAAVIDAARGDLVANVLRYGGKYLGGGGGLGQFIASTTGGGIGTTISHLMGADPVTAGAIGAMSTGGTMGAGMALRGAADARTTRAASEAADLIRSHSPEYAARTRAAPPITDPIAMRRDAIAYAMLPQVRQAGAGALQQAYVPYANRGESYDPTLEQP